MNINTYIILKLIYLLLNQYFQVFYFEHTMRVSNLSKHS